MPSEFVENEASTPEHRFAQNIVAETVTIGLIILFGIASSILIVRGLPQTPVYEFYIYILVFTWVNVLLPIGILGVDVALMKHVPEIMSRRSSSLIRVIGWAIITTFIVSIGMVIIIYFLLVVLPPNVLVPLYIMPYLILALLTIPLTAVSTVLQGVFRGMQEMRFCAGVMGVYHGIYFAGLTFLFISGIMTLFGVILLNLVVSLITIGIELGLLGFLLRRYHSAAVPLTAFVSLRSFPKTAGLALLLALLGSVFLYIPLLIANLFRTSDVILAGLGLALTMALYLQRGQAAPFRVLMPRTAGDVAQQAWNTIKEYMRRAWKLGVLLSAFIAVVVVFFAAPVMVVLFAEEGMVALPFLMLLTGSFLIYPLVSLMMDSLIGMGRIRAVLTTYAAWTGFVVFILWFLCPIGREVVVALIWAVGIPILAIFLMLYQRQTGTQLPIRFVLKSTGVLAGIAVLSFAMVFVGGIILTTWNLTGVLAFMFQVILILTLIPLAALYLWSLVKACVLEAGDVIALIRMSEVLHPVTKPVTWLLKRIQ